jgi:hypothetical protein
LATASIILGAWRTICVERSAMKLDRLGACEMARRCTSQLAAA